MSQENNEVILDPQGGEDGSVEQEPEVQATPAPQHQLPPAVIEEMQRLRQDVNRRDEELHALRVATLRSSTPQENPVEVALRRIQAKTDPDAWKYIAPALAPVLEELAMQRAANEQLQQNVQILAQRGRELETQSQLAQYIPDLDKVGPALLDLVGKLPPQIQKQYADNPALFIPLAEAVRGQGTGASRRVAGARAAASMDTGGAGGRVIPTTADAIQAMNPNSKEFQAMQRAFYGADV
jgi:hypothetical protein